MKKVYIAGPLFDDHEREYLEKIATTLEKIGYQTFLPHRDAGLVEGEFTHSKKTEIFDIDIEALNEADILVALLTGRDVDSGTAAEVGIAYAQSKTLIGVNANNIKIINNFVWGLFDYGNRIVNNIDELEDVLNEK
ncbi:MAG: nucleoside 2-deoxyribosyltransferase [Actinomycetota bacterium]|nr:nucleoside 2-deoxyribosyltransferase [Actinomycetota bacterium]MDA3013763.1 nucleoside 2-deoxyribosyltransferase [Actinomycetota bacterium]